MTVEESDCVGCELPCIFEQCPYYKIRRYYCDRCNEPADMEIDGENFCCDCAGKAVDEEIAALPFNEKCILLGIKIKDYLNPQNKPSKKPTQRA